MSTPTTPSDEMTCIGHCGDLRWTVGRWGHVQHKHSCPRRTDKFCQTHPGGCPSTPTAPSGKALLTELWTWANDPQNHPSRCAYSLDYLHEAVCDCGLGALLNERQSAFLAGLDSPEMLELLAGLIHYHYGKNVPLDDVRRDTARFLASMRSSLRAESDL